MPLRGPCTSCNRHLREGALECPFCKAAVRASPGRPRFTHVALALAGTLAAPSALAQVADAAVLDDAAVDAGPSQAELEAQRSVVPVYGMPPPVHTCGCGVMGEGEGATSNALGVSVLVGAVLIARGRRSKRGG